MKTTDQINEAAYIVAGFIESKMRYFDDRDITEQTFETKSDPWIEVEVTVHYNHCTAATDRGEQAWFEPEITAIDLKDYDDWDPASVMLLEAAGRRLL